MSRTVIIGPPGTGKTSHLIGRVSPSGIVPGIVANLLAEGVQPDEIAFVSYSRAAIAEAKSRVAATTGIKADQFINFRTLHSMWTRALGLQKKDFLSPADFREFAHEFGYDVTPHDQLELDDGELPTRNRTPADRMMAALDWCTLSRRLPMEATDKLGRDITYAEFVRFIADYSAFKQAKNKLDFTDVIKRAYWEELRIECPYLLVDEAQDLSPLQVETIEPSLAACRAAWVVGDPDQAIYQFQGASPAWIRSLWERPDWNRQVLGQSNRCPEAIRKPAAKIIGRCRDRIDIDYRPRAGEGNYTTGISRYDLPRLLADAAGAFVLCRTGSACTEMAELLFDAHIPYAANRGSGPNPLGNAALLRAIDVMHALAADQPCMMDDLAKALDFVSTDKRHGWLRYGAKTQIKRSSLALFRPELADEYGVTGLVAACKRDPWLPLETGNRPRADGRNDLRWLREMTESHACIPTPRVTVTTWHNSKGTEADLVVIDPSLSYACARELAGPNADAEHRCAYVAITRARRRCIVLDASPNAAGIYPFPQGA